MLKRLLFGVLGTVIFAIAALAMAVIVLRPEPASPTPIDFTRYLATFEASATPISATFKATTDPARLLVTCDGVVSGVSITINTTPLIQPEDVITCADGQERPIELAVQNAIEISGTETLNTPLTIRIKQQSSVSLHVLSRVHFNTNVSNFAAARAFYGKLGFSTLSGFPDTNTQAMARAIGIQTPTSYDGSKGDWAGGYLLHGELIGLGFMSGAIDLIEFTIPRDETPPYQKLNHLGMARAVFNTHNLDAAYTSFTNQGVAFLSAPATRVDGTRFAIFTDLDGTFYELAETPSTARPADADQDPQHLVGFGPLNVNVSDFERSRAWYQMFGYQVTQPIEGAESAEVARAMGFDAPIERKGAILTHSVDGSTLELTQWLDPFDPEPPYPIPVNHLGIHRTALTTTDIVADVATLEAQGVEFVSPITPCCSGPDSSGSIIAFYDPDGTIVELVEQPMMSRLLPVLLKVKAVME